MLLHSEAVVISRLSSRHLERIAAVQLGSNQGMCYYEQNLLDQEWLQLAHKINLWKTPHPLLLVSLWLGNHGCHFDFFYLSLHRPLAITFAMKLGTMAVYSTVLMAAPLNLYIVVLALKHTSLFLLLYCLFQLWTHFLSPTVDQAKTILSRLVSCSLHLPKTS